MPNHNLTLPAHPRDTAQQPALALGAKPPLRLLFLTNFYPPYGQGGYEQWCQEIAEGLQARGHAVLVLTSRHGGEQRPAPEAAWIRRELHLEMELQSLRNGFRFFTHRRKHEQENLRCLRQWIERFQPDAVLVWGMWNVPRSVPVLAEQLMPGRVVYYMGDYWPTLPSQHSFYWQAPPRNWKTHVPKQVFGFFAQRILAQQRPPVPTFAHVLFPNLFMRDELQRLGMIAQRSQVIYAAADTRLYAHCPHHYTRQPHDPLALLYAGRITPDKGVHVAIEAVSHLVHQHGLRNLQCRIVGNGDAAYVAQLQALVQQKQLAPYIQFCAGQPKQAMPQLYSQADIFLFTSIWQEPFGRVLVEAMAAGVVVVGSPTGGAAEILRDEENALTFPPGDATQLAAQIARLARTPELHRRLIQAAQQMALEKFDLQRMTSEIEAYLQEIATNHSAHLR